MEEKKARSIRATDETFQRLKALCDEKALDQGAALEALLNTWDVQQAKGLVPERAADVADFDAHVQGLQSAFLRSLDLAKGAEQRARVAYAAQLDALAGTVARLEKELEKANTATEKAEAEADALRAKLEESGRLRFHAEKRVKELEADQERNERLTTALDRLLNMDLIVMDNNKGESEESILSADFAREELRKEAIQKARKNSKKTATVKANGETATYSAETGKLIEMNIKPTKAAEA